MNNYVFTANNTIPTNTIPTNIIPTNITTSNLITTPTNIITTRSTPINTNSYRYYNDKTSFAIAIIFLLIAVAMIIIIILYNIYWYPRFATTRCENDNGCSPGQICQANSCIQKTCLNDSDCGINNLCINSFCVSQSCQTGNDCPTGAACISGVCVSTGDSCTSNSDCFGLTCKNNRCVQCNQTSDCPIGQGCFNLSTCRYPYDGETGTAMITFVSPAQSKGNISAPPAYFCPTTSCGTGPNNINPISCTGSTGCSGNCPFCVNGLCRCTSGEIYETCSRNSDCSSGLCDFRNKICIPSGGQCAYNYNNEEEPCDLCCSVGLPYCVNGRCSNVSDGAMCGSVNLPSDMCNNPLSLGAIGPTGITPNGMGFFCINGFCQQDPGNLNQQCRGNSCEFISDGTFTCTPVNTPSISQMRCFRT